MVKTVAQPALGLLETTGLTPALVALDVMSKTAEIRVVQAELNDFLGVCVKIQGRLDAVQAAIAAGRDVADRMGGRPVTDVIQRPEAAAWPALESPPEYNALIQQDVVFFPTYTVVSNFVVFSARLATNGSGLSRRSGSSDLAAALTPYEDTAETDGNREPFVSNHALGFIETQGFTAVFEAIDTACKAANVEVVGKEKLGGGYVTVVVRGDVAAVNAAIAAGQVKVEGLGKLIAAHVIARPSETVLGLLPKSSP